MKKHDVRTTHDAIAYLTDCTLATVCDLACKKSASKYELRRQISIAQQAIDWGKWFHVNFDRTRAADVLNHHGGNVADWAEQWKP